MVEALAPAVALEADENLPEEDGRQLRRDVPILAQVWLHLPLVGSGTDRHYAPRTSRAKTLGSRRPLFAGAELLHLLPGHALSVIRGADFLYEPKDNGQDTFVLCEINFSCVWSFPPQGHKSAGGRRFACVRACGAARRQIVATFTTSETRVSRARMRGQCAPLAVLRNAFSMPRQT
jgi:hypothetical protein